MNGDARVEVPKGDALRMRVFTHPACTGCTEAVKQAWRLAQDHPELELRTVSLGGKEGLAEARSEHVTTIPTLILSVGEREVNRWVGATPRTAVEAAISQIEPTKRRGHSGESAT